MPVTQSLEQWGQICHEVKTDAEKRRLNTVVFYTAFSLLFSASVFKRDLSSKILEGRDVGGSENLGACASLLPTFLEGQYQILHKIGH